MKATSLLWVVLGLAGCGMSIDRYASKYAEQECAYSVACFDAQILEFNNWVDQVVDGEERTAQEMCELDVIPRMLLNGKECSKFDTKSAKQCLDDWETQGCPENGADPDVPSSCAGVFSQCVDDPAEE